MTVCTIMLTPGNALLPSEAALCCMQSTTMTQVTLPTVPPTQHALALIVGCRTHVECLHDNSAVLCSDSPFPGTLMPA